MIIDIEATDWMPALEATLGELITPAIKRILNQATFEFYEDALDALAALTDIDVVIDKTLDFIRGNQVRVYHGTRLTDKEAESLLKDGLKPLVISDRIRWLQEQFPEIMIAISDEQIEEAKLKGSLLHRENQVHAAISKTVMLNGYDYLFKGSEFDRRLLEYAGRHDLVSSLLQRGKPRLVSIVIPGQLALDAMHIFTTIEMARSSDRYPILVRQMLEAYAWKLNRASSGQYSVDACLIFREPVAGEFIEIVEEIDSTHHMELKKES